LNHLTTRRNLLVVLAALPLAESLMALAQQTRRSAVIGVLDPRSEKENAFRVKALLEGLREYGFVEGKNLVVHWRWAEGNYERLPSLVAELVQAKVDVIVATGTPVVLAAKRGTSTIPIVMSNIGDPVGMGLVQSLARPGGNITGSTANQPEIVAKCLEIMRDAFPRTRHAGFLWNPNNPSQSLILASVEKAAMSLGIRLSNYPARKPEDFEGVFLEMTKNGADAVLVSTDSMFLSNTSLLGQIAARRKLPSIGFAEFAAAGGLLGYSANFLKVDHRAAYYVARILQGTKPADLPVEQPTVFDFVVNLRTAKAHKFTLPPLVLARATRVIE